MAFAALAPAAIWGANLLGAGMVASDLTGGFGSRSRQRGLASRQASWQQLSRMDEVELSSFEDQLSGLLDKYEEAVEHSSTSGVGSAFYAARNQSLAQRLAMPYEGQLREMAQEAKQQMPTVGQFAQMIGGV